jgi:hypothetical protein
MYFIPAPGGIIEEGIGLINDLLDYNTEEPVSVLNCPKLYVADCCPNLIWALQNYTGKDGEKGACKDAIDTLRYLVKYGLRYLAPEDQNPTAGGGVY